MLSSLVVVASACSRTAPAGERDSAATVAPPAPSAASPAVSREAAIRRARDFIARSPAAAQVYLDSVDVAEGETLWHVMFRRRAMVFPNVVTVDVDRRTGAMRFPGDE